MGLGDGAFQIIGHRIGGDAAEKSPHAFMGGDERGYFFESFHKTKFEEFIGYSVEFVQENESQSIKNVINFLL